MDGKAIKEDAGHPEGGGGGGRSRSPVMGVSGLYTQQQQQARRKSPERRENTIGILRLDIGKPRRSSGSSVEFRSPPDRIGILPVEPPSPQPSVDRLSVTFAPEERSVCSETSPRRNSNNNSVFTPGSPPAMAADKVRFSREATVTDGEDDQDEDYSASVCAIMQRRASTRRQSRRRRRPSSPFSPDADSCQSGGRRPSVFTTSSGDTAISIDEGVSQEQIYENLRLHKEVLSSVKQQPWGMRRKLRLVQQAKSYVKRHEGELKERLAQSKTTRDILSRFNILLVKRWQYMRRELANLINLLIPWELRIKEIESHFGSVVASYFTFLRWLFWVNLVITVLLAAFVAIPEMLTADPKSTGERKVMPPIEQAKATNLVTIWNFDGVLKYSPIFYGYYTNTDGTEKGYRLPFAYFMTGLAVYVYSFVATLRRMAENSRMSKLSEKDDECVFTWKLFTGWDYMIGNTETAHNRVASIILGFKEALLEEAERKRDPRNWRVIGLRVLVNLAVLVLLASSAYAVVLVVNRSTEADSNDTWWRQNEITVVLSLISFVFPMLFELLGLLESYHPRKQLRVQLARIMVLNLLNLYTLIFALFGKISKMTTQLQKLKPNTTIPMCESSSRPLDQMEMTSSSNNVMYNYILTTSGDDHNEKVVTSSSLSISPPPDVSTAAAMIGLLIARIASTSLPPYLASNLSTLLDKSSSSSDFFFSGYHSPLNSLNMTLTSQNMSSESLFDYNISTSPSSWTDFENSPSSRYTTFTDWTDMYSNSSNMTIIDNETLYTSSSLEPTYYDWINTLPQSITTSISSSNLYQESTTDSTVTELMTDNDTSFTEDSELRKSLLSTLVTLVPTNGTTNDHDKEKNKNFFTTQDTTLLSTNIETEMYSSSTISNTVQEDDKCLVTVCSKETSDLDTTKLVPSSDETEGNVYWKTSTQVPGDDYTAGGLDVETRNKLSQLCWETMFGQELVKLTVMDLLITIVSTLLMDFIRAIFVRVMNHCWCWDLEKQFPQYGDFKIAENILHLVNNQGMVWMGMFFSPGLPLLNLVKLAIMMYLRSWAVLTCNVPHEVVFRASRSNNFYLALLLTMLFLCVLPVGYAIVWVEPSWHCGPFSGCNRIYMLFTNSLRKALPESLHLPMDYMASPGIVIPLLVLLVLIIYYLVSLTGALREANNDLKIQLRRERTEERRKMFQLVDRRRRTGSGGDSTDTPFTRWRKILPVMPSSKPSRQRDDGGTEDKEIGDRTLGNGSVSKGEANRNEFLNKLMKRALRKSSATSDEENVMVGLDGDLTNADQQHGEVNELPKTHKPRARLSYARGAPNGGKTKSSGEDSSKSNSKNHRRSVVGSPSTSSYRERDDSLASGWSDTIPVIRISKTDSAECVQQQRAEPQKPAKASDESDTSTTVPVHEGRRRQAVRALLVEGADSEGELLDMMEMTAKDTPLKKTQGEEKSSGHVNAQQTTSATIAKQESDDESTDTKISLHL